ncbi:MAG: hypothetical protein CMJ75_16935 [Planctomycetaceae bacterium]|nr:hypothetical protein [Planctomycetaceae bacterium]
MKFSPFNKPPLLAVQWNSRTVDYILARNQAGTLVVERINSLPREVEDGLQRPADLLAADLEGHSTGRARLLLGVPRCQVDVTYLDLPPAKDDELPELVNHQMAMAATDTGEDRILDFLPIDGPDDDIRRVCAVSIHPALAETMQQECKQLTSQLESLVFQPTATAQLFHRMTPQIEEPLLLVNLIDRDVDLMLCEQGTVHYTRGFVVSTDTQTEVAEQLAVEIRRTLAVALAESQVVSHIYLFGALSEHDLLVRHLTETLDLPVSLLDPFDTLPADHSPTIVDVGRFAPLLGMLQEAAFGQQSLDFAHPRETPQPASPWRKAIFYGTAAAILLSIVASWAYLEQQENAEQIADLKSRADKYQRQLRKVTSKRAIVDTVRQWQADDVTWLDELRDVSARFPRSSTASVRKMSLSSSGSGGVVDLKLQVSDPETITAMESGIRDRFHQVRSKRISATSGGGPFSWSFETLITLQRRDRADYVSAEPLSSAPTAPVEITSPNTP